MGATTVPSLLLPSGSIATDGARRTVLGTDNTQQAEAIPFLEIAHRISARRRRRGLHAPGRRGEVSVVALYGWGNEEKTEHGGGETMTLAYCVVNPEYRATEFRLHRRWKMLVRRFLACVLFLS
jgi:hypothetical protein